MKIIILAFNIGVSRGLTNGPGISLYNFAKFISENCPTLRLHVYTEMESRSKIPGVIIRTTRQLTELKEDVRGCSVFHCWSGLKSSFSDMAGLANIYDKPVILGPNLLDAVEMDRESEFLRGIECAKILTVNDKLKYDLSMKHSLCLSRMESLVVGPDADLWFPPERYADYILWKGNSSHIVKDITFAKKVANKLGRYKFLFLGDGRPYDYMTHIEVARKAYLYIGTSLSETKGMALAEQWSAGVPSVTHPKIYLHGENYGTGIITNKDVDSYCDAISEIMSNPKLRGHMSAGARSFVLNKFDPKLVADQYLRIIKNVS